MTTDLELGTLMCDAVGVHYSLRFTHKLVHISTIDIS